MKGVAGYLGGMRSFFPALCILALAAGPSWADIALPLNELTAADVARLVSERNRSLVAARRATSTAQAAMDIAAARPNPTVSLNTSGINGRRLTSNSDSLDTVLRIDQPFERGGKRDLRLALADRQLAATRADEFDTLRQQQSLARIAYFDLKAAEERERLSLESASLAQKVLAKAELRLKAGDLSAADVARIRTDSLKAEGDAAQARVDHQRARLLVAQLLALDAEAPRLATADPWPELGPIPQADSDLEKRPDVVAARHRLESAEQAIQLARSQQVRDVTIGAQIERDKQERGTNLIGVGISIPLFTGYDYRGEIRQAYVARDMAADDLDRLRANAGAELAQASFEAEKLSERARRLRDEGLPAARKAAAAVQLAFDHGAASVLDVIDARRTLYGLESDTTNALADAAKARAAWAAALNRTELP